MNNARACTSESDVARGAAALFLCAAMALVLVGAWRLRIDVPALTQAPTPARFDKVKPGEILTTFATIRNHRSQAINIVGAEGSCDRTGCLFAADLPLRIDPNKGGRLKLKVIGDAPGDYLRSIRVYTDCPETPFLFISAAGAIAPSATGATREIAISQ